MPLIIVLGLQGYGAGAKAELVYLGDNGDAAHKAVEAVPAGKYARGLKLVNPSGVPVAFARKPTKEEEELAKAANARRAKTRKALEDTEAKRAETAAKAATTHAERVKEEKAKLAKAAEEAAKAQEKADAEIRAKMKAENDAARARLKKADK